MVTCRLRYLHASLSVVEACTAAAARAVHAHLKTMQRWSGSLAMLGVACAVSALLLRPSLAIADEATCGSASPENAFDIRRLDARGRNALRNVEKFHFPMHVETLTRGESTIVIGSDIHFVLNYIPNHHRALDAMARLGVKEKTARPKGASFTVDCYFDRAVRFAPDDGRVRMVHGIYLAKLGKLDQALEQYQEAERLMPDSVNVAYNFGLLYFDLKDYDKSLEYAKKAYTHGVTLPGLKNKLAKAGKWPSDLVITATRATPVPPSGQDAPSNEADSKPAPR